MPRQMNPVWFEKVETRIGEVVNASFGGSAAKGVRAILYTSDDKVHLTRRNFSSNDSIRKVTTLKNTVFASLSRDDILARVQRANGDEAPELVVEPIYTSDSSIGRSTKNYSSLKNTVFIQWMHPPSEELLFVVEENSRYMFYLWHPLRGLQLKYTTCTFGGEGTVLSDFTLSPDGNHCLLSGNIGVMLFPSKPGTHGRVNPSEVMDVEAATFMEAGGSGTYPVLITAKYEHPANERPTIEVKTRELLPPDSDNTPQQLVQKIFAGNFDGPVRLIQFSPGRTEGLVLTENALKVINIDPSLRRLTAVDEQFVLHDISRAVCSRSGSGSGNSPDTLYGLAYSLSDTALLCSVELLRLSSESSVGGNHSTINNENETSPTSRNNGLQPPAPLVSVAPTSRNNGLQPPAPLWSVELEEEIVSDSRTSPQKNSDRGVDVSPSTSLEVTQRSSSEFTTKVSQGMDPPTGNTPTNRPPNKDIIGLSAEGDALTVDSGEQETHGSKSVDPTANGNANAKAIVNPFEVNDDDDATKSSRSSSQAGSPHADDDDATKSSRSSSQADSPRASAASAAVEAGGEANTIGAPKSEDDGLKNSQLSTPKRAGSPSNPLPSPTKPSSFERDNASVASDGSKAIELTTSDHRFEDAAKVVEVPPQDGSAINGDNLPSPSEKQTPPHDHLHQGETVVSHVEKPEEPRLPRMNQLQVAQDSSINLNTANSEFDSSHSSSSEGSTRLSVPYYGADEDEDVDQDSAEEPSFSDNDHDDDAERNLIVKMNDDEQTESAQLLRRKVVMVASNLVIIQSTLQQAGVSEQVCSLLEAAHLDLMEECPFIETCRPQNCKITPDELQREVDAVMQESETKLGDVCALNVFERQQLPSSALATIDEGDSDEGRGEGDSDEGRGEGDSDEGRGKGDSDEGRGKGDSDEGRGEDDVMGDESSCEFSETGSPAQVEDSKEVLDFVDLKKRLLVKHQNLVERVKDKFDTSLAPGVEQQGGLEYRLMFGPYDVWSPMIIALCDFSQNKSSVLDLERQAKAFFVLFQDRMTASAHAKIAQRQMILKKLKAEVKASNLVSIDINVSATTASCTLSALDRAEKELNQSNDDDEDIDHYSVAAELAAKKAGITNWAQAVMLKRKLISQIRKFVLLKIVAAVAQMIQFRKIILVKEDERSCTFLDQILPGWRESCKSCAEIWDDFICPKLQAGISDAEVKEAYWLTMILVRNLSYGPLAEYFAKAEAIFLNQLVGGCNVDQCLRRFQENGLQSYFVIKKQGQQRRLGAASSFFLATTFMTAMRRIRDDEYLSHSVYGIHCLGHSCFAKKDYKILSSEKLIDPQQPEDEESIENLVNKLLEIRQEALGMFAKDHLVLDLTTDINNNTDNSLQHLKEYFDLCIPKRAFTSICADA